MSASSSTALQKAIGGIQRVLKHTPRGVAKYHEIMATKGEGCYVHTADGRKLLDMTSGIGVTSTGHCHPAVVKAVQEQAATLVHAQQNIFGAHPPLAALMERLVPILPRSLGQIFLANSGSEAVDNAVKIARSATGRPNIVCLEGGFHGRTMGAMALTTSKTIYSEGFSPLMPGVHVAPYPYCLHCKVSQLQGRAGYSVAPYVEPFAAPSERVCCGAPLQSLEWLLRLQSAPRDTAAIIIEPILGEGGFLVPPPGYLAAIRALCTKHGMLMIVDEVQSGAARSGRWWGHEHFMGADDSTGSVANMDLEPDMLIFAKGIASGYPMAGVAARQAHFDNMTPGALGGTYGGNAVACAAAVATIDVIHSENLLQNATDRGIQLMQGLVDLSRQFPEIVDIRGRGLMVGVEFGDREGQLAPVPGLASAITKACMQRDMLLLTAGARESLRFLPPLIVTAQQIDTALAVLAESLQDVLRTDSGRSSKAMTA